MSKKQSIEKINNLIDHGNLDFGENYVQEGVDKIKTISNPHSFGTLLARYKAIKQSL